MGWVDALREMTSKPPLSPASHLFSAFKNPNSQISQPFSLPPSYHRRRPLAPLEGSSRLGLDRLLVNSDWSSALPDSTLTSTVRTTSDHVPIHLEASSKAPRSNLFRPDIQLYLHRHCLCLPIGLVLTPAVRGFCRSLPSTFASNAFVRLPVSEHENVDCRLPIFQTAERSSRWLIGWRNEDICVDDSV